MARQQEAKQPITIVTACMQVDGFSTFAITEVEVTAEERAEGVHYYLAQTQLLERGYEEPFVYFFCGADGYVAFGWEPRENGSGGRCPTPHNRRTDYSDCRKAINSASSFHGLEFWGVPTSQLASALAFISRSTSA